MQSKQPAWELGYKDRTEGKPITENPFPWIRCNSKNNTQKIYWDNGWEVSDKKITRNKSCIR